MKVTVFVTPKKTVLDPQGAAVGHAMEHLNLQPSGEVRVGKTIEFELDGSDTPEIREQIDSICNGLLCNPVIEDYRYEIS
ncbi:MAG: phosphoribosylformylglycinamidine synthase subunit PurS [Verrucomicrobiota bacterium]